MVNNVLPGTDLEDGSKPGPAPGAFAFVDPLVIPLGPGIMFPPVMFPGSGQGFPPVVTFGHPTVSFPGITQVDPGMAPVPMSGQPLGAIPCVGAGQGAPPDG